VTSIGDDDDEDRQPMTSTARRQALEKRKTSTHTIRDEFIDKSNDADDPFKKQNKPRGVQDEYRERRLNRAQLSPERADPFADKTPQQNASSYADIMQARNLERKEQAIYQAKRKKDEEEENRKKLEAEQASSSGESKKRRWDSGGDAQSQKKPKDNTGDWGETPTRSSDSTPGRFTEATPGRFTDATPGRVDATPGRADETPFRGDGYQPGTRWDATPNRVSDATPARGDATPARVGDATPARGRWEATPARGGAFVRHLHADVGMLPPLEPTRPRPEPTQLPVVENGIPLHHVGVGMQHQRAQMQRLPAVMRLRFELPVAGMPHRLGLLRQGPNRDGIRPRLRV